MIARTIKEDQKFPKKQRHTVTRIYHRIKEAVREIKRVSQEVYIPLVHHPGEAQVDLGFALAKVSGALRKVALFIMASPYSDAICVAAFDKECSESYWEGYVRTFGFLWGASLDQLRQ